MNYVLMQDNKTGQFYIVDNSTHLGKKRVENDINRGIICVGKIESDLKRHELTNGFCTYLQTQLDEERSKIRNAIKELTT